MSDGERCRGEPRRMRMRGMSRRVLGGLRYYEEGEGGCRGVEGLRLTDGEQVETPRVPDG